MKRTWLLPAIAAGLFGIYYLVPELHDPLVLEDGPGEWAQFGLYLAAGMVFAVKRSALPAIFFLLLAAEEVSWGYRVFGYSFPWLQNLNRRHDVDLHNLIPLDGRWFYYPIFYTAAAYVGRRHRPFAATMLATAILCTCHAGTIRYRYVFEMSELIFALSALWLAASASASAKRQDAFGLRLRSQAR